VWDPDSSSGAGPGLVDSPDFDAAAGNFAHFPSAEHTQEWHSDPDGWDAAVVDWLRNVQPSSSALQL
jgi:hypothetical protein